MRLNELLKYSDIIIQCHDYPDADTLASGYGVYLYLLSYGITSSLIYSGKQKITKPNLIHMIKFLEIPIKYVEEFNTPEALVTVDCCYGEGNVTKFDAENIYVIDHHRVKSNLIQYNCEIQSSYSSCSTIIYQMLKEEQFNCNNNRNLMTALYYGLYTDSNGMDEIYHPADRDLRDLSDFDEVTISILKNSNLSLEEMKIAGDALKHYKYNDEFRFALVEAMPCDPNILGFISDLLIQVDKVDTCVVFCCRPFGVKLSVRSCINDIRANEMVRYIVGNEGTGGGHSQKAGGNISKCPDDISVQDFISGRIKDYYSSYTIIYANDYKVDISELKKYIKKPVTVGYVKSTDILATGTEMCIRTLEADLNVFADDNLYIMIGISGEVYPIKKDKFEASYGISTERFILNAEYSPSVIIKKSFKSINLIAYAKSCYAKGQSSIYAKELDSTVKVYTAWDKNNYMLGQKGDFIAFRSDDMNDIYIIERNIFFQTYTSAEE